MILMEAQTIHRHGELHCLKSKLITCEVLKGSQKTHEMKPHDVAISPETGRPLYTWTSVLQLPTQLQCTESSKKPGTRF